MSDARYSNITAQLQNCEASPKTGCAVKKYIYEMQMDQHVGLILSTILRLCASSKHSGVKRTCSARAVAFTASYLHIVSVLRGFFFSRDGRVWAGETQQEMDDTQRVAPRDTLVRRLLAFERQCVLFIT